MSNISRRKFLKGAGAAALAVAAAGVLAGCSNQDVIDAVTTEDLSIVLRESDGALSYTGQSVKAKKGDKVGTKDVEELIKGSMNGLMIADENDDLEIDWDKKEVYVDVCEAVPAAVQFVDEDGVQVGNYIYVNVPETKTTFTVAELEKYGVKAPEGYKLVQNPAPAKFVDGVIKVAVYQ